LPPRLQVERMTIDWLPYNKRCAICVTIDDIHPASSRHGYEAGGNLAEGALRHVIWLTERHPALKLTLFVTADWREKSPVPTRRILAKLPVLRDHFYLAPRWPKGTMRLDRHPDFASFLANLKNVEVGLHGLYHCRKGPSIPMEFHDMSYAQCHRSLRELIHIMKLAGICYVPGICPPGWHASPDLLRALVDVGLQFVASARDIRTPISRTAVANMSGLSQQPLIFPSLVENGALVHLPTNFQATNSIDRAEAILEAGGLLSIKAHIIKSMAGHVALDGLDSLYANYIDVLLKRLQDRFADSVWWTSMSEITNRVLAANDRTTLSEPQTHV
jgi:hypothetical protein